MRKIYLNLLYLTLLSLVSTISFAQVTVNYVTDTANLGAGTLRDALENGTEDTVVIDIHGELKLINTISVNRDVVILGPSPVHFQIDLGLLSDDNGLFSFNGNDVYLSGVEIKASTVGVFNIHSSNQVGELEIEHCLFTENKKSSTAFYPHGGVLYSRNFSTLSKVKFNACSFWGNEAAPISGEGGALYAREGELKVYNSTFYANKSKQGGAIKLNSISIAGVITNNTFYENKNYTVTNSGNDVYFNNLPNSPQHVLNNNIFKNNDNPFNTSTVLTPYVASNNFTDYNYSTLFISDHLSFQNNYGINLNLNSSPITDGFGLKYFTFIDENSLCIDVDTGTPVTTYDARRSWRKMAKDYSQSFPPATIDAGAIEYTPFVVKNNNSGSTESFNEVVNNYSSTVNSSNYSIVFEIPSSTLSARQIILSNECYINPYSSLIINGFSQEGSRVPGPKDSQGVIAHGKMGVELNGSNISAGTNLNLNYYNELDVIITGLSITQNDANVGLNCLVSDQGTLSIEGNHIGLNIEGDAPESNYLGVNISTASTLMGTEEVYIGKPLFMLGYNHNARNVISSNSEAQIELNSNCHLENNYVGLNSKGDISYISSSLGILHRGWYPDPNINIRIGGVYKGNANYFAGQDTAVYLKNAFNAKVQNNYFGFLQDKISPAGNSFGISLEKGDLNIISSNVIGNCLLNEGDAINLNLTDTTYIYNNLIGLAGDSSNAKVVGAGIKVIGTSGIEDGTSFTYGGRNHIIGNTITNSDFGISYGKKLFYNSNLGSNQPSRPVYLNDEIKYNIIGYDTTNTKVFSDSIGIYISDSILGIKIENNIIGNNTKEGLFLEGGEELKGIKISKNGFFLNGGAIGLGIDLDGNTVADTSVNSLPLSNEGLIPSIVTSSIFCSEDNSIKLKIRTRIIDSTKAYRIEFFRTDPQNQEGMEFVKDTLFLPNTLNQGWHEGNLSFLASALNIGDNITSTLTMYDTLNFYNGGFDSLVSTSEFGAPFTIGNYSPSITGLLTNVCVNEPLMLSISGGYSSYSFNTPTFGVLSDVGSGNLQYLGNINGSESIIIIIDSLGCSFTETANFNVNDLPIMISPGNDDTACNGENITIDGGSYSGVNSYFWEFNSINFSNVQYPSIVVNNSSVGTYSLTVTDNLSGCFLTNSINIYVNDCTPLANPDSATINEDGVATINIILNDNPNNGGAIDGNTIDLDITSPSVQNAFTTTKGNWTVNLSNDVVFLPNPNFNGRDSIYYNVKNSNGITSNDTLIIVDVTPVNDPPSQGNETLTGVQENETTPTTSDVLTNNNTDVDGTVITLTAIVSSSGNGTVTINLDGSVDYTPLSGFNGVDTVIYTVCDSGLPTPAQCVNDTLFVTVSGCDLSNVLLDCDGDGVTNGQESTDGTFSNNICDFVTSSIDSTMTSPAWDSLDCDNDGIPNRQELVDGTDPSDFCSNILNILDLGSDLMICEGESFDLNSLTTITTGIWTTTSNASPIANSNIVVTSDESYIFSYLNSTCTVSDTISIIALTQPSFDNAVSEIQCNGDQNGSIEFVNYDNGVVPYSFQLDFNGVTYSSTILTDNLAPGTYTMTLTDGNTCVSTEDIILIDPSPLAFDDTFVSVSPDECIKGTGSILFFGAVSGGTPNYEYSLDNLNFTTDSIFNNLDTGFYNIYVKDQNGCSLTSTQITIHSGGIVFPSIPKFIDPINYCEGSSVVITDTASLNSGLEHRYYFYPSYLQDTAHDENIPLNNIPYFDSVYVYAVSTQGGCSGDTVSLKVNYIENNLLVKIPNSTCEGDSLTLTVENNGINLDSIQWEVNGTSGIIIDTLILNLGLAQEGLYSFLMHEQGCEFKEFVTLSFDLNCGNGNSVTTNAFNPNSLIDENQTFNIDLDYINDGLENIVTVYNRWGDVIKKIQNYENEDNAWDGKNMNGDLMPEGTYFYVVEVPEKNFSTSGWVYLNL